MMRDFDEDYEDLMDELEAVIADRDSAERGDRMRSVRLQIEDLLREQMGLAARVPPADRRHGCTALN